MRVIKYKSIHTTLIACFCCVIIAFFVGRYTKSSVDTVHQLRQNSLNKTTYKFIDPLLACGTGDTQDTVEYKTVKNTVLGVIDDNISSGKATKVSVYFDTRDGRWIGINMNEKYSPASLFKVPFMIAILKKAELNPYLLDKSLVYNYSSDENSFEHYKPEVNLKDGDSYTVSDLLEHLIAYSDNNAIPLLQKFIEDKEFKEVSDDLGIHVSLDNQDDFLTVKSYAGFFRVLYNASYLSRDMSEKALTYLSKPDFKFGIRAGVPEGTVIAQKFGERTLGYNSESVTAVKELHDCGVVYYPKRPYLLCIMTKGTNFNDLANTIKDISSTIYTFIDSQPK